MSSLFLGLPAANALLACVMVFFATYQATWVPSGGVASIPVVSIVGCFGMALDVTCLGSSAVLHFKERARGVRAENKQRRGVWAELTFTLKHYFNNAFVVLLDLIIVVVGVATYTNAGTPGNNEAEAWFVLGVASVFRFAQCARETMRVCELKEGTEPSMFQHPPIPRGHVSRPQVPT